MSKSAVTARFLARWGFSLAITALACLAAMAVYTMLEFREFSRLEAHTNEVVAQLHNVEANIERAETSQRGYLLTKKIAFLKPYHRACESAVIEADRLRDLVSDNPVQVERAAELRRLIGARLDKMHSVVEASVHTPSAEVAKRIDYDIMAEIRVVSGQLEAEEMTLLAARRSASDRFSSLSLILLLTGGSFSIFLILVSSRLVRSAHRRHVEQSALLTQVFDIMSDGVLVVDKNQRVIHSNRASDEFSERSLNGLTLKEVYEHNRPSENDKQQTSLDYRNSSLARALNGETVLRFEVMMGSKVRRLISVDARAVRGEGGEIVAAFCTYQDITQRRAIEQEWENARESALEASRLKSDFLATMSHEIRTPMNGVMGMATLLLDTQLNKEQQSYVQTIKGSADSLLTLINQVLDHSKIESGKLELDKQDFDLHGVVDGVLSLFRYLARSKGIELNVVIDPAVPPAVHGDPNRLRQILLNLVGNALKFTEQGFVEIFIKAADDTGHKLEFSVKDTGPGIPLDKQSQLFQKFSQVHDKKYVKAAGSGLGLVISRELVRVMGGEMGLESAVGLGSRFWFTAVFEVAQLAGHCEWKPKSERTPLSGRVLVAEDQLVNQMVVQKFLESFGLTSVLAEDGGAAVQMASEENFDLILMDCRMIPVDGYEATRQIREFNKGIPIIALTAEGISGDRRLCFEAGMNEVLNKPIDIDHLHRVLQQYLVKPEFDELQLEKLSGYDSGDQSLIEVLSEDFFTNGKDLIAQIANCAKNGDFEKMKDQAHALRSPALTLGLAGLAQLCAELEGNVAAGPSLNLKVEKLNQLYNRACGWLSQQVRSSKAS